MSNAMKMLYVERKEADENLSLKEFARKLLTSENEAHKAVATHWLANKNGVQLRAAKAMRQTNKGGKLIEIRMKVKASRRKGSQQQAKPEVAKKAKA